MGGELFITMWRFLRLRSHNQLSMCQIIEKVLIFFKHVDLLLKDILLLMFKRVPKPVFGVQRAFLV